jgi:hypothetical protein
MDHEEILLIHLGGLGDICLSESTFLSLAGCFGTQIVALGSRRFFDLFPEYFLRTEGIESARWLYLFSDEWSGVTWRRIIFIGKDREGRLRTRWERISKDPLIFVEMYPDYEFRVQPSTPGEPGNREMGRSANEDSDLEPQASRPEPIIHIEEYQLAQLEHYGIRPIRKEIEAKKSSRVILYPEIGMKKDKWPLENFVKLYESLKGKGIETHIIESLGAAVSVGEKLFFQELKDVKAFFFAGGIFISNDSGMAHFAGACGLFTITIFTGFDPATWHPRGVNLSLRAGKDQIDLPTIEARIVETLRG